MTAHAIAARLSAARQKAPDTPIARLLEEAARDIVGTSITYTEAELSTILSPRHFVNVRKTLGGPAPEVTARAVAASRAQLAADAAWWSGATNALAGAERNLAERSAVL